MLEVIGAGVGNENGSKTDFVSRVKSSEQYRQLESNLDREVVTRPSPSLPPLEFKRKRAASNWVQATFLTKRWFNLYWRTPSFNLTRIVVSMVLAISLGVSYLDTEYVSYQGVNSGMGMVYMAAVNMTIITFNSSLPITCKEQTAFYRERASESYNAFWYFVGATLVEIPYCFGTTLLFMAIFYPMTDFTGVPAFFTFWLSLSLIVLLMSYFGQFLAFLLPSLEVASVFMVIVNIVCTLFTGFNPPAIAIPSGYKWIYLIVPNKYAFASLAAIVFGDCPSDGDDMTFGETLGPSSVDCRASVALAAGIEACLANRIVDSFVLVEDAVLSSQLALRPTRYPSFQHPPRGLPRNESLRDSLQEPHFATSPLRDHVFVLRYLFAICLLSTVIKNVSCLTLLIQASTSADSRSVNKATSARRLRPNDDEDAERAYTPGTRKLLNEALPHKPMRRPEA
ncbi:hypothetical protein ON010_g12488 [Phytophthora cinnamomi]|nr:hypothetical protein ON010_g12488 [Phytophthora cinnamomi]